jgi:hypothetical protein
VPEPVLVGDQFKFVLVFNSAHFRDGPQSAMSKIDVPNLPNRFTERAEERFD